MIAIKIAKRDFSFMACTFDSSRSSPGAFLETNSNNANTSLATAVDIASNVYGFTETSESMRDQLDGLNTQQCVIRSTDNGQAQLSGASHCSDNSGKT